jgi:DNA-binding response OmpR family regulator
MALGNMMGSRQVLESEGWPAAVGHRGTVLVVEDSLESAALLSSVLEEEGFRPLVRYDGHEGLRAYESEQPIAVLLDWVVPGGPGLEICRRIREQNRIIPIFFISGREDEASVSRGLDAGADDFLVKPFRPRELVARLEASLRKAAAVQPSVELPEPAGPAAAALHRLGEAEIDLEAREVRVKGEPVALGPLEFKLLEYFVRNPGVALSRDQILREVYEYDAQIATDRVDLLVRRLRSKLGWADRLVAVPGYGYRLERQPAA